MVLFIVICMLHAQLHWIKLTPNNYQTRSNFCSRNLATIHRFYFIITIGKLSSIASQFRNKKDELQVDSFFLRKFCNISFKKCNINYFFVENIRYVPKNISLQLWKSMRKPINGDRQVLLLLCKNFIRISTFLKTCCVMNC